MTTSDGACGRSVHSRDDLSQNDHIFIQANKAITVKFKIHRFMLVGAKEVAMKNILSIDVEDWFHILEVDSSPDLEEWDRLEGRVRKNYTRLLDIIDRRGIKVTCFFLGYVAKKYPELVLDTKRRGHEIASHGYAHQLVYTQTREAFYNDILKTKNILEEIINARIFGYRAPGFSITDSTPWAFDELTRAGYRYDSSVFPASRTHGGIKSAPLKPYILETSYGKLVEFPISVINIFNKRLCFFGGGYLRLFPYWLIKWLTKNLQKDGRMVNYYIHPREIDLEQPRLEMGRFRKFKTYINLKSTEKKLEKIIRDNEFINFSEVMELESSDIEIY